MAEVVKRRKEILPAKVRSNREIIPGVFVLEVEKLNNFIPGQVIAAAIHADDDLRLYSIASGVNQPFLRILYDVKPEGQLTPPMSKLKEGDTLYVSAPFGRFTKTPEGAWWIATGTGIAPFISMVESEEFTNRTLLHGARYLNQFYYSDLFKEKMGSKYLRFCTAESSEDVVSGRLTTFLKESSDILPERKYYLCGNANMVVEVRDLLLDRGVPFDHIIAEIYF
jgi:ferredoxin/flavodoxin---NADP+ reductase